jgi:hypothetical protein
MRLPIDRHEVICPLTRRAQPLGVCGRCPMLQGSLDGVEPCVLCGAPARRAPRGRGSRRHLIFDADWPDEPD